MIYLFNAHTHPSTLHAVSSLSFAARRPAQSIASRMLSNVVLSSYAFDSTSTCQQTFYSGRNIKDRVRRVEALILMRTESQYDASKVSAP